MRLRRVAEKIGIPGLGRNSLMAALRSYGLLKRNNEPVPFLVQKRFAEVDRIEVVSREGFTFSRTTTHITPTGYRYLVRKILPNLDFSSVRALRHKIDPAGHLKPKWLPDRISKESAIQLELPF